MNPETLHIEAVMRNTLHQSEAGTLTFPQVVSTLAAAGVESYRADLLTARDTFYLANSHTHVEPMSLPALSVAADFSAPEILSAIRAAQADSIRYPEFLCRIFNAGCVAYQVFITGRQVIYFGRKGEMHIELFPNSN